METLLNFKEKERWEKRHSGSLPAGAGKVTEKYKRVWGGVQEEANIKKEVGREGRGRRRMKRNAFAKEH